MTITAAALAVEFEATGVPETSRAIDQMNQKVERTSEAGRAAGAGLLAAGAAGLAAFGKGLGLVTDFESRMSGLGAVTGTTGKSLAALDALALKIGQDTSFSASTAADALAELAKAGVSVEDILKGAGIGATDLAAAAGVEVPEAARLMSNALNVFRLTGDQASHVADVFAAASNKSAADARELGFALQASGTVAGQFGLGLEETVGALALFADYGLRGSDAGTSLKSGLLALLSPTKAQRQVMNDLNISFFDAQGNFIGLESLAGTLQNRMAGLTQEQRQTALATLFGSDAVRAASILYAAGAGGVAEYTSAVNDSGAASEMAAARLDNLAGDLEELSGSAETVAIKFLRFTQGPLRQLVQRGTEVLNWLGNLNPQMQQMIAIGGLLASVVATLAGGWALFGDKIMLAVRGMALLSPPLLLITGLVAGLWLAWQNNFGGIQDLTKRVVEAVGQTLGRMSQFFQAAKERGLEPFRLAMRTLIVGLGERLGDNHPVIAFLKGVLRNGEKLADWITRDGIPTIKGIFRALEAGKFINAGLLFGGLLRDLRGGWDRTVGPWIDETVGTLRSLAQRLLLSALTGIQAVDWDVLGTRIQTGLQTAVGALAQLGGWILDRIRAVNWDQVRATLALGAAAAVLGITTGFQNGLTALGELDGWVRERVGAVDWEAVKATLALHGGNIVGGLVSAFVERFPSILTWLAVDGLPQLTAGLVTGAAEMIAGFSAALDQHYPSIAAFFTDTLIPGIVGIMLVGPTLLVAAGFGIITGLLTGLQTIWESHLKPWLGEAKDDILADFDKAETWLLQKGQDIVTGLLAGIQAKSNELFAWFNGMGDAIGEKFAAAATWLVDRGREILDGLRHGIVDYWNNTLAPWFRGVEAAFVGFFGDDPAAWLSTAGSKIMDGLRHGIVDFYNNQLVPWFRGMKDAFIGFFPNPGEWLKDIGGDIIGGLKQGVEGGWTGFSSWFEDKIAQLPGQGEEAIEARSPARKFMPLGRYMVQGIGAGALAEFPALEKILRDNIRQSGESALREMNELLKAKRATLANENWVGQGTRHERDLRRETQALRGARDTERGASDWATWVDALSGKDRSRLQEIRSSGQLTAKARDLLMSGGFDLWSKEWGVGSRAAGGPVTAGRPYVVGERRPELFVPSQSGYIHPSVGGGQQVNQTFHITMSLQDVKELVEAARFVQDLDQTRTLYLGAH